MGATATVGVDCGIILVVNGEIGLQVVRIFLWRAGDVNVCTVIVFACIIARAVVCWLKKCLSRVEAADGLLLLLLPLLYTYIKYKDKEFR